ncbi:GNAT family N-acetyltransferase [Nonomuraea sp. MCN248]|uniref:GNAT family N-acetyltransferase n=1 Tax=Nonomuraea corallina TaxID=2989783 RepID=A0ABT4SCN5_9ACTN|nr:GNAT family N-acetyltransferase [Nonomuraea corallina]MDA0634959.1 GNAT family N-acetyltransferase [Nonomuraea corallina]
MEIRELRLLEEFHQAYELFDDIWRPDPRNVPMPVELMIAFAHAGGYVAGAYEGERLVGASVGFLAADRTLHSHVTGAVAGHGAGHALKLHQREWCLRRGLERITWTFDPLVRRNARFNLVKLGARPEEYLERFYGVMADAINGNDESDRLLAVWRLDRPAGTAAEVAYPSVLADSGGRPVIKPVEEPAVLVATPPDIEAMRRHDPQTAREWRLATRETLGGLMAAGARVTGFTADGEYVVERD